MGRRKRRGRTKPDAGANQEGGVQGNLLDPVEAESAGPEPRSLDTETEAGSSLEADPAPVEPSDAVAAEAPESPDAGSRTAVENHRRLVMPRRH